MIDRNHPLPIARQAAAMGISRGSVYYLPRPVSERDQQLMKRIDRLHLELPFAGAQDNLSGTDFHASPAGVRRKEAPNTKFAWSKFERVFYTRPVG